MTAVVLLAFACGASLPFLVVPLTAIHPLGQLAGLPQVLLSSTPRERISWGAGALLAGSAWVAAATMLPAPAVHWTTRIVALLIVAAGTGLGCVLTAVRLVGAIGLELGLDASRITEAQRKTVARLEWLAGPPEHHVDDLRDLLGSTVSAYGRSGAWLVGSDGDLVAVRGHEIVVRSEGHDRCVPLDGAHRGRAAGGYAAAVVVEQPGSRAGSHERAWHVDPAALVPTYDEVRAVRTRDSSAAINT